MHDNIFGFKHTPAKDSERSSADSIRCSTEARLVSAGLLPRSGYTVEQSIEGKKIVSVFSHNGRSILAEAVPAAAGYSVHVQPAFAAG